MQSGLVKGLVEILECMLKHCDSFEQFDVIRIWPLSQCLHGHGVFIASLLRRFFVFAAKFTHVRGTVDVLVPCCTVLFSPFSH